MPRRIEVELTSTREDGTWTWRAAGAREPKGTLDGSLLPDGAKVGDVVRADADFDVDGIVITGVLAPKAARREPERLEILGRPVREQELVTSTLVEKRGRRDGRRGRRDRDGQDGRDARRERSGRSPRGRDGEGGENRDGRREGRARSDRRPARPAPEPKPKPKRLRPGRAHRSEVLASLPEEERPIAEQVVRGGIPAVRQAVEKQNEQAKADGQPTVKAEPLLAIAERLLPRIKEAEWRDRADAAIADLEELDLRDLRSVVVASDNGARDDEARELAARLREGLNRRVEQEHSAWLAELDATLVDGRVVRALRLSSRPPKAGAPLPPELATRLAEAAGAAFGPDITQDRWATVLDAVSYSPVRQQVTPGAIPSEPTEALLAAVRKHASRVPAIAAAFGVSAESAGRGRRRSAPKPPPPPPPPAAVAPDASESPAAATEAAATEAEAEHAVPSDAPDAGSEPVDAAREPQGEPAASDAAPEPEADPEVAAPEPVDSEAQPEG